MPFVSFKCVLISLECYQLHYMWCHDNCILELLLIVVL